MKQFKVLGKDVVIISFIYDIASANYIYYVLGLEKFHLTQVDFAEFGVQHKLHSYFFFLPCY